MLAKSVAKGKSTLDALRGPSSEIKHVEPPNRAFIEALVRGERSAQSEFFERYDGEVERMLRRVLGPDPEMEDLCHETFLQATASIRTFRGDPDKLRSWVRSIAVRTARKRLRFRRMRAWIGTPHDDPELVPSAGSVEEQVTVRQFYAVLDRIPAQYRVLLALRFLEGMELQEIADATGSSLSTVKRHLPKAKRVLERYARHDVLLSTWIKEPRA